MKYEYQGIKLGDSIEKIINLLNNENTSFDDFYSYLIYEPGSAIEDITSKIHVYLYTGTIVFIQIFDEDFCLAEDLKIGTPISKEMIEKYGLYEDDIAEDEGYYESTKYKELVKDIRGAVLNVIEKIITSEFGNDTLNHIRLRIQSNTEKEWENKIETLTKAVEVTTSISDLATFSKQKIKDGALSYVSNIVGVDFGEILEKLDSVDDAENGTNENHEEDTENFDDME